MLAIAGLVTTFARFCVAINSLTAMTYCKLLLCSALLLNFYFFAFSLNVSVFHLTYAVS